MRSDVDPITDFDLAAYVDDQLPVGRRIDVEAYLAGRPEEAAKMMDELRTRDELRIAISSIPLRSDPRMDKEAAWLGRSMARRGILRRLSRVAALALMLGIGWIAHAEFNALGIRESLASAPPPPFVADAIRSHGTSAIRAAMVSQVETADYDPVEILSATAIRVPDLPDDWTVLDVQVFPSTFGPSLEMALGSPELGNVSLFATRPGTVDRLPVGAFVEGNATAAYWQVGEVAYALVSRGVTRDALEYEGERIAAGLR